MITITEASIVDIKTIQNIAHETWPLTYGAILSKEQLDYMLDVFYSETRLSNQIQNKEELYFIAYEGTKAVAFMGIEHNYKNQAVTQIHKIYISAETQAKGIGRTLIDYAEKLAKENNSTALSLNVNRFNKALHFYYKVGFKIIAEENKDIGNGFLMEDYVMEKPIPYK